MTAPAGIDTLARGDARAAAALHAEAFDTGWPEADFAGLLADRAVCALGWRAPSGALSSFIMVRKALDEAEILTLATTPDARRQGQAAALLQALGAELKSRGVARLFLEVAEDNAPALALYRGAGFEQIGRRPGYYTGAGGARADGLSLARAL